MEEGSDLMSRSSSLDGPLLGPRFVHSAPAIARSVSLPPLQALAPGATAGPPHAAAAAKSYGLGAPVFSRSFDARGSPPQGTLGDNHSVVGSSVTVSRQNSFESSVTILQDDVKF
jgi:hypothetical protein